MADYRYIKAFADIGSGDVAIVGGKNASLGEMFNALSGSGIRVPDGFAVTAEAYREYLRHNDLNERIAAALATLDTGDTEALARTAARIRAWISGGSFPDIIAEEIGSAYQRLEQQYHSELDVAVRSSATAEDLPDASFAGQQETYLHIRGISNLLQTCKQVLASLFTGRAICYRVDQGFEHMNVALSIGVQKMVRADKGASGVMFTLDTESGFRDVVLVTAAYGLGENVVGGAVNPDEFMVYKPALEQGYSPILQRRLGDKKIKMIYAADTVTGPSTRNVEVHPKAQRQFSISDNEVLELARMAITIEKHYTQQAGQARPMDIEWARDGAEGDLYIVQARPETVHAAGKALQQKTWQLQARGNIITRGRSIGRKIGSGRARIILEATQMHELQAGEVLVTDITDPDWEPIMKRAAAIVTNRGGRVCHAAIIARELGIPAVVGTNDATRLIPDGETVTVSCAEGDEGFVYEGELSFDVIERDVDTLLATQTKILLNIGNPGHAYEWSTLPADGIGLARLEFIINNTIGIHPAAILDPGSQTPEISALISAASNGYTNPREFYIERMAEGIGTIAAAFHPRPVHVRLSDFKSSEYAALPGGRAYEPSEENPMLGLRGASRYYSPQFRNCFQLECEAILRVRDTMGLKNIRLIIPFVRSVEELDQVLQLMAANGLQRGRDGLQILVMCELPANVVRAEAFLQRCDGFSIGSNDLTQLTLGVDRESSLLSRFDERDAAVKEMMRMAIMACKKQGKYVSICGQAPSDFPEMAAWLVQQGIDAISVNHDSLIPVIQRVITAETHRNTV